MSVFVAYEQKVVTELLKTQLETSHVDEIVEEATFLSYEHTGAGYYLVVKHPSLPRECIACNRPHARVESDAVTCGFLVFVEDGALTLECHGYGPGTVPKDIRERDLEIALLS